jgi:branched-chain amino acid transport system ATP-binding protein
MSVLDNLKLGGFILAAGELERRLDYVRNLFPLVGSWLARRAGSLSGGEQQLLALARAMMSRPRILLLDEPLTGLAPVIQARVLEALMRIAGEHVGILLVEQNLRQSLRVVSRGILIEQGRIVLEGTNSEMRDDPRIVEGYLGIGDRGAATRPAA